MSGRILCKLRSSLTADHMNELTVLNKWLHEELHETEIHENAKAGKSAHRRFMSATRQFSAK